MLKKIISIIPVVLNPLFSTNTKDFSRNRKLTLSSVFTFILSISSSGGNKGLAIKISEFFRNAERSNLIDGVNSINKSSIIKARNKIPWQEFEFSLDRAVEVAYENFPKSKKYQWKDLSVYAVDGSKYTLPSSDILREEFDPNSGFDKKKRGKGHYPQCLVSTIYDVFRRIPIARSIAPTHTSERDEFLKLLHKIPSNGLFVFDRGYPSYEMFYQLNHKYQGYWLFRSPTSQTFTEVKKFLQSGENDGIIYLNPGSSFRKKYNTSIEENEVIKLRIIVSTNLNGDKTVFLTNMFDEIVFKTEDLCDLYYKRWEVEVNYRNEKESLDIDYFHSKNPNGIKQELYAVAIMTIFTRLTAAISTNEEDIFYKEPQFKNAILTFANDTVIFISKNIKRAVNIFKQLIESIKKIKYYKPKKKRKEYSRISKRAFNKWIRARFKKWEKS